MYAIYAYIGGVWGVNVFITQTLHETAIGLPISWGGLGGQCRHMAVPWSVWGISGTPSNRHLGAPVLSTTSTLKQL